MATAAAGTAGLIAHTAFGKNPSSDSTGNRPNVLFIICDDLNDTVDGMGGHPQAITPNINRLMQRGIQFTNAHCNAPICGPSRASLWTGLYPSTTGYFGYQQQQNRWRKFPAMQNAQTIFEHFRSHGYDIYATGKIFHNGHDDPSVWQNPDGTTGFGIQPSFGPFPWDGQSKHPYDAFKGTGHPSMPPELQNKYWESFGPLSDVPTIPPNEKTGVPGHTGWMMDSKPFRYVNENDRDLMADELSANWATEKLGENHNKPFFMAIGFNRPHVPRYAPQKYFDMFPLDEIQLPPYLKDDLLDTPEILWKDLKTGERTYFCSALPRLLECGGELWWKKWVQSYLACVALVDDQLGVVLDALNNSAYADNTIIVFTGDHGYHMGEKDNLQKTTIWEEVTRVPMVIVAPGVTTANTSCTHPISLVDMYPTLIDLCGLPDNPNRATNQLPLDGHSIRPFLENPDAITWEGPPVALNALHGPNHVEPNQPAPVDDQHFSVRDRRYRYTLCCNGEEEFYDHEIDPHEWHNRADNERYADIKSYLRNELVKLTSRRI